MGAYNLHTGKQEARAEQERSGVVHGASEKGPDGWQRPLGRLMGCYIRPASRHGPTAHLRRSPSTRRHVYHDDGHRLETNRQVDQSPPRDKPLIGPVDAEQHICPTRKDHLRTEFGAQIVLVAFRGRGMLFPGCQCLNGRRKTSSSRLWFCGIHAWKRSKEDILCLGGEMVVVMRDMNVSAHGGLSCRLLLMWQCCGALRWIS